MKQLIKILFLTIISLIFINAHGANFDKQFYEDKMSELIKYAKVNNPKAPFAAMIVHNQTGKEICRGINKTSINPMFHGEIDAINNCVNQIGNKNINWKDYNLITTAEPCPMCQGAIIWSGITKVVYGTSINSLVDLGWNQIKINSQELTNKSNFNKVEITGGILKEETDLLFYKHG